MRKVFTFSSILTFFCGLIKFSQEGVSRGGGRKNFPWFCMNQKLGVGHDIFDILGFGTGQTILKVLNHLQKQIHGTAHKTTVR